MSTHLDRKALKRPDAFLERAGDVLGFISSNAVPFVVGLAAIFVVGVGVVLYNAHVTRVAEEADTALFAAQKIFGEALAKADKAKAENKDAKAEPAESWDKTAAPGMAALEKVGRDFAGSRAAFEAQLIVGDVYLKHGDPAKAIEHFKAATETARPRAAKPAALYALAYAYESAKNYDGAIDALRQVLASENAVYKTDASLALARNYALKGDKPKAIEAYGQVVKDSPNTPAAKQAEIASSRIH